jgi:transposase
MCSECGKKAKRYHDFRERSWRHLDVMGKKAYFLATQWRVVCGKCGVVAERVPWAEAGSRFTEAMEREVAWMAQRADYSAVAATFRIAWRSVRRVVGRVVGRHRDESWKEKLWVMGVDEISYRRRHKYVTVVVDHLKETVAWAGKDRKAETLERFFEELGAERAAEIDAATMDMWEGYVKVVKEKAPQAQILYDRFHIVRHLNEAVDKIRRELVMGLKGEARRDLRNTKFPLLKSRRNRTAEDWRVLEEQVRANRPLYRAMLLKDDFMDLYTYRSEAAGRKFLKGWLRRVKRSGLEPLKKAARMIEQRAEGILGWITWQVTNGRLEGMNNRIRLLSHRSFGLHSAEALINLVYLCCSGLVIQRPH